MARPCDLLRHAWFEVPTDWTPPYGGVPFTFRCERCSKERRDAYGQNNGVLMYRRYVDPPGWVRYTKDNRPTMDDIRLDWIKAHITEARKARRDNGNGKRKNPHVAGREAS